jgi:S1-C subfamily serine protease
MSLRSIIALLVVGVVAGTLAGLLAFGVFDVGENGRGGGGSVAESPAQGGSEDFDPEALYRRSADSVVLVLADFHGGAVAGGEAIGSGFVASDQGHIITNAHVVQQDGRTSDSVEVAVRRDEDREERFEATIVGVDATTDIAVLRVDDAALAPLPLGDSSQVAVGEPVVAIGNPLGFSFSLTAGVVSGVGRNLQAPNGAVIPNGIQTDAAINQGNSGGPLIDAAGDVIGVNEQIASPSGSFSGLGFAVPINTAKEVMRQFVEEGEVRHAFLGIQGQTITPGIARALDLPVDEGVLIASVQDGTAAAQAGLRGGDETVELQGVPFVSGGDVITALDGEPLRGMEELAAAVAERRPGDRLELTILRDGEESAVEVMLGERPS